MHGAEEPPHRSRPLHGLSSTGELAVHAIQPTAVEHGSIGGANLAGGEVRYAGSLGMSILDVVGLQCASLGLWQGDGREQTVARDPTRPGYRKLVWEGQRLVGAILLGPAEDVALLDDLGMIRGSCRRGSTWGRGRESAGRIRWTSDGRSSEPEGRGPWSAERCSEALPASDTTASRA